MAKRDDIDDALQRLRAGVAGMEARLANTRPDLLPQAADYDQVLRERLDGVHEFAK